MPEDKKPDRDPCPPPEGVSVPVSEMRITSFSERAGRSEESKSAPKKLPPKPGPLPQEKDVDPRRILNRKNDTSE